MKVGISWMHRASNLCVAVAVSLASLVNGESASFAAQARSICSRDALITPGHHIGALVLGMSVQDVSARLGTMLFRQTNGYIPYPGTWATHYTSLAGAVTSSGFGAGSVFLGPSSETLSMYFVASDKSGRKASNGADLYIGHLEWAAVSGESKCRTGEGVAIGSQITDVRRNYGGPSGIFGPAMTNFGPGSGFRTVLTYAYGEDGISFVGLDGKVVAILIFRRSFCSTSLVEACSDKYRWGEPVTVPLIGNVRPLALGTARGFDETNGIAVEPASEFHRGEAICAYMKLLLFSPGAGPQTASGAVNWIAPSGEILTRPMDWDLAQAPATIWADPRMPDYEEKVRTPVGVWQVQFMVEGVTVATTTFTLTP